MSHPTILKNNYVQSEDIKSPDRKTVAVAAHQAVTHRHLHRQITDVMTPSPNTIALTNGQPIIYYIQKDTLRTMTSFCLRFQVRADTQNIALVPTPFWFDRIEFYIRRSGDEVARYYADALMTMLSNVSVQQNVSWSSIANFNNATFASSGVVQNSGTTKYYYLPLPGNVLEGLKLDFATIDSDLEVRMFPSSMGPLDGVNSVANGVPSLLEVAGIFQEEKPDVISHNAIRHFLANNIRAHTFLNSQLYLQTNRTLNASTQYDFDLDQFDHLSAGLLVCFRTTARSNATNDFQTFASLADGTIDVLGVAGESIYGGGRAVRADYLKLIVDTTHWGTNFFQATNSYLIPFGDFEGALVGKMDGLLEFNGQKMRLQINTPASWSATTYNVYITSFYFRRIMQNGASLGVKNVN